MRLGMGLGLGGLGRRFEGAEKGEVEMRFG